MRCAHQYTKGFCNVCFRQTITQKISDIDRHLNVMHEYLSMRSQTQDWHGVMDSSADIRELTVEKKTLQWVLENL